MQLKYPAHLSCLENSVERRSIRQHLYPTHLPDENDTQKARHRIGKILI